MESTKPNSATLKYAGVEIGFGTLSSRVAIKTMEPVASVEMCFRISTSNFVHSKLNLMRSSCSMLLESLTEEVAAILKLR
jgi:hypothetical protein